MTFNEQIYPKQHSRWPIKHKGTQYPDRLSVFLYYVQNDDDSVQDHNLFLRSDYYYVRAALEAKFNRHFSPIEIKHILQDKSWQWRDTPSQP